MSDDNKGWTEDKLVNAQFQKRQETEPGQLQESSQLPQDTQKTVNLIASLPGVAGRLEMPHQIVDKVLKLLDPYEQAVYLQHFNSRKATNNRSRLALWTTAFLSTAINHRPSQADDKACGRRMTHY